MARNLTYGPTYLIEKAKIMNPTHQFQKDIELRLADEVREISWWADTSLFAAFVIVFVMMMVSCPENSNSFAKFFWNN